VRASFELPFAEGLVRERALFDELMQGEQSRALRYVFRAERKVAAIPGMPADVAPAPVRKAAVIGAGTMGSGIAMCFANAGIPVVLLDSTQEALDRGFEAAARNYATSVKRGSLSAEAGEKALSRITRSLAYEDIGDADVVVEAVFEEMAIKQDVMRRVDAVAKPGAILASNTSTLDIDAIAGATKRPESVIGTHFLQPRERHAPARSRPRREDVVADDRDDTRARENDRQGRRPFGQLRWLHRQPDARTPDHRSTAAVAGGRVAA
jgi:3-hydroxyacyl-CoA dehydrogenase